MTTPDPVDQAPAEQAGAEPAQVTEVIVDPASAPAAEPEVRARGTSLRAIMTLGLSVCAVAFLAWMVLVHPNHQSLFGPAPTPQALAASQPPPPHPTGG